jgi:hypothetical protein
MLWSREQWRQLRVVTGSHRVLRCDMGADINFSRYSHEWIALEEHITLAACEWKTTLMKTIKISCVTREGSLNIRITTEPEKQLMDSISFYGHVLFLDALKVTKLFQNHFFPSLETVEIFSAHLLQIRKDMK